MDGHISIDLNLMKQRTIKASLKIHLVVDKNITIVGVRLAGNKNILKQWEKTMWGCVNWGARPQDLSGGPQFLVAPLIGASMKNPRPSR